MNRGTRVITFILIVFGYSLSMGGGTSFVNIATDPSSGLYYSDFSMGTAVFDFNNDGLDDIVVTNYAVNKDRLYMSNGDGTFTDMSEMAGVATPVKTLGIATADIDANGFMDFMVFTEVTYSSGSSNPGYLYLNNGDQTFSDAGISELVSSHGYVGYAAAFADINRDGNLDVYYGGRMFLNDGNLNFNDVTESSGIGSIGSISHVAFGDIDNDFDPDLVVCRQYNGNTSLFLNDGTGNFSSGDYLIPGSPYGLCATFGDVENDGDLDLFLSYSNKMYLNDGSGQFSINSNCDAVPAYTRGAILADFDNDGDPDLFLPQEGMHPTYHENMGGGIFIDKTDEVGILPGEDKAGGIAIGDFEGDGDLDIYIAKTDNLINPCFINQLDNNNSIVITPRGTISNFSGIGAKAYIYENGYVGEVTHQVGMAELTSTSGFCAGTTGRIHLGTGGPGLFDVRVVFPSGAVVDEAGVASGSRLIIYESGDIPNFLYVSPSSKVLELSQGSDPEIVEFSITDSKGESIEWTASSQTSFIEILTPSGTTPATLQVRANPSGLGLGNHTGQIVITSPDAVNTPNLNITIVIHNRFLQNIAVESGMAHSDFSFGAAFFDYDLDGDDDIFVNNINGQCRLYQSNGTIFENVAVSSGVEAGFHNLGVFGGDLNADDWPDILSFTEDKEVGFTYLNTGYGNFVDAQIQEFSTADGFNGYAASAADIDNDGDLDVFYGAKLFRNDGNFAFADITEEAGLLNIPFTCRAAFGDVDNDGDMDIFMNRQNRAPSLLFINDGTGHFLESSYYKSSLGYFPTAVGVSFGDVDNDGDLDMYTCAGYSDPNKLFINDGNGYFTDNTGPSGTSCTNYSRGSEFVDIDLDGDLDLIVANENRSAQLFANDGSGIFTDITDACGIDDGLAKAGAAVVGDYDNDGDMDIFITRTDYIINSFFENNINLGQYITIQPVGIVSNRAAVGTKAYLYPAGQLGNQDALYAFREYNISNGFNGSGSNRIHFGTGTGDFFDLRLIFPSGAVYEQTGITPGMQLTVYESGEIQDYLVLIPGNFNFNFKEGDDGASADLTIRNSAGNAIPWTAVVDDSWCQLSEYSGVTDDEITITVNPFELSAGYYEANITITANDAINSPRTISVRMIIESDQPVLALSSDNLYFTAEYMGFNPWPQSFTILNTGQGTLDWTLTTSGEEWLEVYPLSGSAPTNVQVTCAINGLEPGLYTSTITVTSPEAIGSPAQLTVNLEVIPGDTPEKDTVRIESVTVEPGQQVEVPVYLNNVTEAAAFSIPLKFDNTVLMCDSVSYADTRVDYINVVTSNIDSANGQVLLGMVVFMEDNLAPGEGMVARMFMTIYPDAEEQVSVIDTLFFPPGGEFSLFDPTSAQIVPEFIKSNIFISLNPEGDADGSGTINVGDAVYLVNYCFKGQRPPIPIQAGDANTDENVNVGDVVYLINYIFRHGPPPNAKPKTSTSPVYYYTEEIPGKNGTEFRLYLNSDVALGGVQCEFYDRGEYLTISDVQIGELVEGLDLYGGKSGKSYRFGIVDLEGAGEVRAGEGALLSLTYDRALSFEMNSFMVFDKFGNELPVYNGHGNKPDVLPSHYSLEQNYPNPFNPSTTIKYAIANEGHVKLSIYNVLGQKVVDLVNTNQKPGAYTVIWDGNNNAGSAVASGVYFYRLKTEVYTDSKKMILLK
ncbi:MAG: FG-GAP-like repeat-containing protein [candidate division Zixibacteria bacterium]